MFILKQRFLKQGHHDNIQPGKIVYNTGIDNTFIDKDNVSVDEISKVAENFWYEMPLVEEAGFENIRLGAAANRIMLDSSCKNFNWKALDLQIKILKEINLGVIFDALHHNNFFKLPGGFLNQRFVPMFVTWIQALVTRYPDIKIINPLNEPLTDGLFPGLFGKWFPYLKDEMYFYRMIINLCRAICEASHWLKKNRPDIKIIHIDTCEHHQYLDLKLKKRVDYLNHRRFLVLDLMLGRVNEQHPLFKDLTRQRFGYALTQEEMKWFQYNPAQLDILGVNYYPFHEQLHGDKAWLRPNPISPLGFAEVLAHYWERYQSYFSSVQLTELNVRGLDTDRVSFMRHMAEQVIKAQYMGIPITSMHPYPYKDTVSWSNECTNLCLKSDGHGMFLIMDDLDEDPSGRGKKTLLYDWMRLLVQGKISPHELPAFRFENPVRNDLIGFIVKFMSDWEWVEPAVPQSHEIFRNKWEAYFGETLTENAVRHLSDGVSFYL